MTARPGRCVARQLVAQGFGQVVGGVRCVVIEECLVAGHRAPRHRGSGNEIEDRAADPRQDDPVVGGGLRRLGARVRFSHKSIRGPIERSLRTKKKRLERHHLFPRAHLEGSVPRRVIIDNPKRCPSMAGRALTLRRNLRREVSLRTPPVRESRRTTRPSPSWSRTGNYFSPSTTIWPSTGNISGPQIRSRAHSPPSGTAQDAPRAASAARPASPWHSS